MDFFGVERVAERLTLADDAVTLPLFKAKKCIVITGTPHSLKPNLKKGAGVSTSAGIPDFRSEDGLYNLVKKRYPHAVIKGKDLFDAGLFRDPVSSQVFFTFMAELKLLIDNAKITKTHLFLKWMNENDRLMRCYTQNIDCLEEKVNLKKDVDLKNKSENKLIQLHGDMSSVICTLCKQTFIFSILHIETFHGGCPPACTSCQAVSEVRLALGKRAVRAGTLRPNIVLYNESHSGGEIISEFAMYDQRRKPDFLIVMGTSLKVEGVKKLVKDLAKAVHSTKNGKCILINKTELTKDWDRVFDYIILGETDEVCQKLESEIRILDLERLAKSKAKAASLVSKENNKPNNNFVGKAKAKGKQGKKDVGVGGLPQSTISGSFKQQKKGGQMRSPSSDNILKVNSSAAVVAVGGGGIDDVIEIC